MIAALFVLATATAAAQTDAPTLRVVETLGATGVVRDALEVDGALLLATSGGVVIRRGAGVEDTLDAGDGLRGSRLVSLSLVADGVWVGGVEGTALIRRDGPRWRVVRTLALRRVQRVVRVGDVTWFATFGDGLHRLGAGDGAAPERVALGRHSGNGRLTDLVASGDSLWVATSGSGVLRTDAAGVVTGRFTTEQGMASDYVWDLELDGDRVLAAGIGGVSVIRGGRVVADAPETRAAATLGVPDVRAIARSGGVSVVGTWGAGVWRLGPARAVAISAPGEASRVHALVPTSSGLIAAHEDGAHGVDLARGIAAPLGGGGLPTSDVTSMVRAFGALYVGTFDRGLVRVELGAGGALGEARRIAAALDARVNDVAVTRSGANETLWVATDRGLFQCASDACTHVADPAAPGTTHVTSMHVDARGDLWVTSSRQLARRSARGGRWQAWNGNERTPVLQLHAVTTDAMGRVWVGSLHGLFHFDPSTGSFTRHTVSSGDLPVDWVTAVLPWGGGVVAGTYHGGLVWYDGRSFRIERERARSAGALPSGWVNPHAMRWVGDTLFVGTLERGLAVGRAGRWRRATVADGLPSDDVTAILPIDARSAYVATRAGLARIAW